MQLQKPKIEIYRTRTFTEKLTDTFDFLRDNWRPILKYFTYFMLPISMVVAVFVNHAWNGYVSFLMSVEKGMNLTDMSVLRMVVVVFGLTITAIVAYVVLESLIYAMIRVYRRREDLLNGITFADLRSDFFFCMKRGALIVVSAAVLIFIFVFVLSILIGVLASVNKVLGLIMVLIFYLSLLVMAMPLMFVTPTYLLEDQTGLLQAYKKAFRLGFATWGGIFALMFVVGLLTSVLQSFTMMPWYLLSMVKMMLTLTNETTGFFNSFGYTLLLYLTCILQCLGYLLSAVISTVAITMQYGHASDKIDGVGVAQQIDHFDEFDTF